MGYDSGVMFNGPENPGRRPATKAGKGPSLSDAVAIAERNVAGYLFQPPAHKGRLPKKLVPPLSPEVQAELDRDAVANGLFDQPEGKPDQKPAKLPKPKRRQLKAAAAAAGAGLAFLSGCAVDGLSGDGDHTQPGGHDLLLDISPDGLGPDNMIFAEDLQAYELPDALKQQIGAALIPVQIHAGPDQPLSHHEIAGIVVAGTDGNPYLMTLNPAQGEYDYYVNGEVVAPDYQANIAVISTDAENASHMLKIAEGGLPSSTEALHLVTLYDGKLTFTEVLVGSDESGNPIIFAPPHRELLPGELSDWDLLLPATRGGFVVNDNGEVLGFFGDAEMIPYQEPGTDPSNPELFFALTGSLEPVTAVRPPASHPSSV